MPDKLAFILRYIAACLITLSGIGHIAALWLRPLTEIALLDALLGSAYLLLGIGLYGRSRFSLFMAIVLPGFFAGYFLYTLPDPGPIQIARIATSLVVAVCSALVLWHVRHNESV